MSNDLYTTKTASLKATRGKFRKLDTDKLTIKGQDISELIGTGGGSGSVTIKHSQDTRETVTQNDLWGQWIETLDDGTVIIHDDYVQSPYADTNDYCCWNYLITKVEDNKVYEGGTLFANVQFDKVKNGSNMFCYTSINTFTSDLNSLENGHNMFKGCSQISEFNSDLKSLTNANNMFYITALTSFSSDLSSLIDGSGMFFGCENLTSFTSDLPSLTDGYSMFQSCRNLTSFSSNLSSLIDGNWMFNGCNNLKSFSSDLTILTNGEYMFNGTNLTYFDIDLPNLTNGYFMFQGCYNLTAFSSDLPNLTEGCEMFKYCNALASFSSDLPNLTNGKGMFSAIDNLTSFSSDLSSLTDGYLMFSYCKLNSQSVMYIIHSIKDIVAEKQLYKSGTIPYVTLSNGVYSVPKGFMSNGSYVYTYNNPNPYTTTIYASSVGKLTIGIDVTNNSSTIAQQLQTFAEGALFDSWDDLKQAFVDKGWTVTWQYGGTSTSITYDLREGERIIPCPVYTKLIEILPQEGEELTKEEKNSAEYCNQDGTKFYNIEWGHDVTHPQEFQQFDSLETACVSYGVIPKEYLETNGQTTLF